MMLSGSEEVFEVARWLFMALLTAQWAGSVESVQQFTIHRMQHIDIGSTSFGPRVAYLNMEARSEFAPVLNRRCVFVRWSNFSLSKFDDLVERGAGALVIILPVTEEANISMATREEWMQTERELLLRDITIPIYFMTESEAVLEVMEQLDKDAVAQNSSSALAGLLGTFKGYGYYVTSSGSEPKAVEEPAVPTVQALLKGQGLADQLPTVAIVAHYDTFGVSTGHSTGADSNGSGMVALLELARLFSKLYSSASTRPQRNILFLATGGGKLSYFGSKEWLEENIDEGGDSWLLANVDYFVCLDAMAGRLGLNFHVAKVPKEGSALAEFAMALNSSSQLVTGKGIPLVSKKIRLSDDILAWEHERFAVSRHPAVTLSHLDAHHSDSRHSVFDDRSSVDCDALQRNVEVVAEGIAQYIYNLSTLGHQFQGRLFSGEMVVNQELMMSHLHHLTSYSRAQQMMDPSHPLILFIVQTLSRYASEVERLVHTVDKSNPEFKIFDTNSVELSVYSVKPPIFDLLLAILIALYLGLVYLFVQNFERMLSLLKPGPKLKST